jgi:hypothetical protein
VKHPQKKAFQKGASSFLREQIGDGLVSINSALGRHADSKFDLHFLDSNVWIGQAMGHMDLLSRPEVYEVLKKFMKN